MRILLATDGSPLSDAAVEEVCSRPWPEGSEVKVLSVAHAPVPEIPDPFFLMYAGHEQLLEEERERAPARAQRVAEQIRGHAGNLQVTSEYLEGPPKKVIVEEAERWKADLILVGSHGYGPVKRFLLGSVAHAVALHAPCSVEIVRQRPSRDVEAPASQAPSASR